MNDDPFHGDRPIGTTAEDRFGFAALATRVATALTGQAAGKGFVLGLQGKWGSGKSSLLALTLSHLNAIPIDRVAVIEFRPWLIGDRDQLLSALFEDLAKAVAGIEHAGGDATSITKVAAADVAKKVRKFASHLGPLGKLAGAAGLFVPGASAAGDIIEKIAAAAVKQADGPTLAAQKEDLSASLEKLGCRIVVAIDDVDRLEPKEVAELLRLVRSVADFPNVSYLLCYDGQTLARAIETATGVPDGTAYLEKIVQIEVAVPRPESFALRRWFSSELQTFAGCAPARVADLQHVIDETGGRALDSPRSVVRVLDSLRLFWPSLRDRVDLADLVWLRMIVVASPNLYRWIEGYLTAHAALATDRVTISERQRKQSAERLDAALEKDGLDWKADKYELERHLPGIQLHSLNAQKDERLFSKIDGETAYRNTRDMRLASASHGRLYFSLIEPTDGVSEPDISEFVLTARDDVVQATALLVSMGTQRGDAGASKADRLLDQLRYVGRDDMARWPAEAVALAFTNATDELAKDVTGDEWGYPRVWYLAKDLLGKLNKTLPAERQDEPVVQIFASSTSIGFLSYLLRDETFGHGFFGDRPDPHKRLTTPEAFDTIRMMMLARFESLGIDNILERRDAATMLYAWTQAGGRDDVIARVEAQAADDAWFVRFVRRLCGNSTSSVEGTQSTLSLSALANFFKSPTAAVRRAMALADHEPPVPEASAILDALKRSVRFDGGDFEAVVSAWEDREQGEPDSLHDIA